MPSKVAKVKNDFKFSNKLPVAEENKKDSDSESESDTDTDSDSEGGNSEVFEKNSREILSKLSVPGLKANGIEKTDSNQGEDLEAILEELNPSTNKLVNTEKLEAPKQNESENSKIDSEVEKLMASFANSLKPVEKTGNKKKKKKKTKNKSNMNKKLVENAAQSILAEKKARDGKNKKKKDKTKFNKLPSHFN